MAIGTKPVWRGSVALLVAFLAGVLACTPAAAAAVAPVAQSAVLRVQHGAAGSFDSPLSLTTTNPTIEPRQISAATLVITFDKPVTGADVAVIEGTAIAGAPTFSGSSVSVGLTGVGNLQHVTIALTSVTSADGGTGGSRSVRIAFLLGDVNQSRVVSVADLGLVNAQLSQPVTVANFLKDVNASGTLTLADKGITNTKLTQALVAPASPANQAPAIAAGAVSNTITLPAAASLNGSVTDDGLPNPPGATTTTWSKVSGPGTVTFGNAAVIATTADFSVAGTYVLRLSAFDGQLTNTATVIITVNASGALPPDPSTLAPPIDPTTAPNLIDTTGFLYTGPTPIQTGVAPGTIDALRAAVVRGRVLDRAGAAISGVQISVLGHPELGQTLTRVDGRFDMAVNGGGLLTLKYTKTGYLPVQRQATVPWQDYRVIDDVVMIPLDAAVTAIDLTAGTPIQVARGSVVTDGDGTRRATMFFAQGTTATIGGVPVTSLSIRATEYTVGPTGPQAMPGVLPPTSGYTYAVELSADEAAGQEVQFSQPVVTYVENFLAFPVGGIVPVGYYDRARAAWVASNNGRVIKILSVTAGKADIDTDGDGLSDSPATLAALGITDAEQQTLGTLYASGQTLWRVPITHFTPWDCNWPYGPPPDAIPPGWPKGPLPKPKKPGTPPDKDCLGSGSIIYCQSQALGETLPVTGTSFELHYNSDRMPANKTAYTLEIPLTGATLPASLTRLDLEIAVAGRRIALQFAPTPGQSYTFEWDGKDAYGRATPGSVTATVRLGYVYALVLYQDPAQFDQAFGAISGIPMTLSSSRTAITLWSEFTTTLGTLTPVSAVAGWSLSPHHAYDPAAAVLYQGDGTRRNAEALGLVINTVVGDSGPGFSGDGGPAKLAQVAAPSGVAVGPDGSVYIADPGNNRIRRIGPDGIITTVAGTGTLGFWGDGGPAVQAWLNQPGAVAVAADGSLYIADTHNSRIRRVGTDGVITTVAGNGVAGFGGDGGPATLAALGYNESIAVAADGSFYFADLDTHRVRRVAPNGIINTVAGTGVAGFNGDGISASVAQLNSPRDVTVGPDGSLYIADAYNFRVRRIGTDGIITSVAGSGAASGPLGDGGPATLAALNPFRVTVASDGGIFIAEPYNPRVRYVGQGGIITTAAGTGTFAFFGDIGDGGLATRASLGSPVVVALAPDGSLYMADGQHNRVRRIAPVLPGLNVLDRAFASEDGTELYVLNGSGRHLRTQDTMTGSVRYQFGYDGTGRLITITDGSGNITTIVRDGNGNPTSIIAPGGQQTTLTVDASGYLATVANPANEVVHLSSSSQGLLLSLTDPMGGLYKFTYDTVGLLVKDEDPVGGVKSLVRVEDATGHTVTLTTALGRIYTYQVEKLATGAIRRTNSDADGAHTIAVTNPDGTQTITQPDGMVITSTLGPDPRFGMQSPLVVNRVRTLPGGQVETTTASRSVTLSNPDDPLSLLTLTDSTTINGHAFARNYVAATRTLTSTSAEGRQSVSVLDAKGRPVQQTSAPGLTPFTVTYDAQGRVIENRQGTWFLTYGYDTRNRVSTTTDAAGRQTVLAYDNADRIVQKTLPGGAVFQFAYDANGNRTQVVLPSGAHHVLGYSPVDLDASYTPPGNGSYLRVHDVDRALTTVTLPGGRVTSVGRDAAGRVNGISYLEATTTVDYFTLDATDRAAHVNQVPTAGPAQNLAFSYNGGLISGMTATGAAPASVAYTFGNDFVVTNMNLTSGVDTVTAALTRDQDGILTGFGPFTLTRAGPGGALSAISDGTPNTSTAYGYDALGRKSTRSHQVNAQAVYALQVTYDVTGRLAGKSETIGGTIYTQAYTYDNDGQLTDVTRGGAPAEHYAYDANGNRTSRQLNGGPIETGVYDAQDRLAQRGPVAYVFNADGFLAQRGADTFQYNARGQLIQATVGAQPISYAYDGIGRRVSRTDAGGTTRYLYGDPASHLVTAVRDSAGALTKLYYDTAGMLIALERGSARYHVAVDQVGTPRVVSDNTGVVVKIVDADSFGNSIADNNPGFDLPIGYAGGLVDPGTGLVHFGLRDYDTASGRWTGRDPVLFAGGQGNLYVYVGNSPLGNRDPLGLFCISVSVYEGLGGGVQSCFSLEGASVCGEAGAGVGSTVAVDMGKIDDNGISLVGEITVATAFAKVGLEGSLDPLTGCVKAIPKAQVSQGTRDWTGKRGIDLLPVSPGVEGKFGVKVCVAQKF